jgi:HEAT repeat protein
MEESLSVIDKLQKSFPTSHWLKDAKALSLEIHADAGHPVNPASESDQDLKLLALNTLMQTNVKAALPALLKVINGDASDRTKEHALFVLAQSDSPDARKALMDFARQPSNQTLQLSAVRMMGMVGGDGARKELAGLYTSSSNAALKHEILNGMMLSGSKSQLLAVAKQEADSGLRNAAIANLSLTGGEVELSDLYNSGASLDEKTRILSSVYLMGDGKIVQDVLKSEKDPGVVLKNLYRTQTNDNIRRAVLDTLAAQRDSAALTELARDEKDAHLKTEIWRRLSALK